MRSGRRTRESIFACLLAGILASPAPAQTLSDVGRYLDGHAGAAKCQVVDDICKGISTQEISRGNKLLERAVAGTLEPAATVPEVVRLTILLLKYDPSGYAVEAVGPYYQAHQSEFEGVLRTLTDSDQRLWDSARKIFLRESAEGNG